MEVEIQDLLRLPVWLAFDVDGEGRVLAGHDGLGSVQLVELAPDGARTELTNLPGACSGGYLPGTRSVVVCHDQGGDERRQLSRLRLEEAPARPVGLAELEPLVRDQRYFHNLTTVGVDRIVYATNRRNQVDFDVIVRDVTSGAETLLYQAGGAIEDVAVAPDGIQAVLVRSSRQPMSQQLLLVELATGRLRELTDPNQPGQHSCPRWLRDGTLIVTTDRDREFTVVARLDPATGEWTELVADRGHDVAGWPSPDGKLLFVLTNHDGAVRASLHESAQGARLRGVELPAEGWAGDSTLPEPIWSPDGRFLALSFTSPSLPGDILRIDAETGAFTTLAQSGLPTARAELVQPAFHRVPTPDGERVPCFVYPGSRGAEADLTGSSVLYIHGGPEGQSVRRFLPIVQALAAAGHTVLVPNVRGSVGFGRRWYSADDVRLRFDSVRDLASIHAWLPSLGLDPTRVALWGGSYGGYMVLAGLAFQPQLWAAGVDIVGISSLVTFLENTSSYRRMLREREYGSLEDDRAFLESISPLSRIEAMQAPIFIIHGANDPRVPLSEARQLRDGLAANGVECQLVVYPDEGHGLAKRVNRLDAYPRAFEFLARHLGRSAPPPVGD